LAIRESTAFSSEEVNAATDKIRLLLEGTLSMDTAWEITQWYRGTLFVLVDRVMVVPYQSKEEETAAAEFLLAVIDLLVEWVKQLPALSEAMRKGIDQPELFYTDTDVALAQCWPEMLFTLTRLFGGDERCNKFFKICDPLTEQWAA
jgi:hypothetical protein